MATIRYPNFYRSFVMYRLTDLTKVHKLEEIADWPYPCVLHLVDNLLQKEEPSMVPRLDNPMLLKGPERKFMVHVTEPVTPPSSPLQYTEKLTLPLGNMTTTLLQFKHDNNSWLKVIDTPDKLPYSRQDVRCVINYNPLYRARMFGILRPYRMFNYVFTTIMNTISTLPAVDHFIHIPVDPMMVLNRTHFMRSFKSHQRANIIFPENVYYLFLMQLIDYVKSGCTTSLFATVPTHLAEKIHFVVILGDHCLVLRMDLLKSLNGDHDQILIRLINLFNELIYAETKNAPPPMQTDVPEEETEDTTKAAAAAAAVEDESDVAPKEIVELKPETHPLKLNIPKIQTTITSPKEHQERADQFVQSIQKKNIVRIVRTPDLPKLKQDKATAAASAWKRVEIGGAKLEKLVTHVPPPINTNHLDFLEEKVEDKSMLESRVTSFSTDYMKHQFPSDLAKTLLFFNGQGMMLQDLQHERQQDELNHLNKYTASYQYIDGSSHTIKFTLPAVDDRGYMFVNGTTKTMKLQRFSNPICKVKSDRVSMTTTYNKALVERTGEQAHSFEPYFKKYIEKLGASIILDYNKAKPVTQSLPYEYTVIGRNYIEFKVLRSAEATDPTGDFKDGQFRFDYETRFKNANKLQVDRLEELEKTHGVYLGSSLNKPASFFINLAGKVTGLDLKSNQIVFEGTLMDLIMGITGTEISPLTEWCDLRLLDKSIPVGLVLCYKYGLIGMLKYLNATYTIVDAGKRIDVKPTDLVIRFLDKKVIIPRYPFVNYLIFAGLTDVDLSDNYMEEMETSDLYYGLMLQLKLSPHVLKGVDMFYELFIGPKDRDILLEMGEPTNVRDLLIRAVQLLTTEDRLPSSSRTHHRFRSYERMVAEVYNSMARAFATWKNKSPGATNKFAISEFQVKARILQDQLTENVDIQNPIGDIKYSTVFSHSGMGGRDEKVFTMEDRVYTKDCVGTISEATVDNSGTGLIAYTPMNPTFTNYNGMTTQSDLKQLKPAEILSITGLLFPGVIQDDKLTVRLVGNS